MPTSATQVRDGTVAYDLLRPLDLYSYWFGRTLAVRVAGPTLRGIPMVLFSMILLPLVGLGDWALIPPASAVAFAGFVASLVLAAMLATAITLLAHISLLWTISGVGMDRVLTGLVTVFSGLTVPLPLFPDWLQPFLNWQPFRGLADVPYRIYSGNIPPAEIAGELVFVLRLDDRTGLAGTPDSASRRPPHGGAGRMNSAGAAAFATSRSRCADNCSTGRRS